MNRGKSMELAWSEREEPEKCRSVTNSCGLSGVFGEDRGHGLSLDLRILKALSVKKYFPSLKAHSGRDYLPVEPTRIHLREIH